MRPGSSVQWSAYPALLAAGAFAAGIVLDGFVEFVDLSRWFAAAVALIVLLPLAMRPNTSRIVTLAPLGRALIVFSLCVVVGGARHSITETPAPRTVASLVRGTDEVSLAGTVSDAPTGGTEKTTFTLEVDTAFVDSNAAEVAGAVRTTLAVPPWAEEAGSFPAVRQGDRLHLTGSLSRPPGQRNPGGFDYRAYLERRGICCTLYVSDPGRLEVRPNHRSSLEEIVVSTRELIRGHLQQYISSSGGRAVLRALLLGDRSRISDHQRDRFAKTGLMHLLAVSGLHVFLVGMVLYTLLRPLLTRLGIRWRPVELGRAAVTVAVLVFYMLLTGAKASVVRAVVMASLFIGAILFQRTSHPLNTLGVAALLLLAVRPAALYDVGFQLSLTAVAGIVVLNPRLQEPLPNRFRESEVLWWVITTITTSAAAILATAPILLYHFGWVSVAGLVLNIAGIPCTALALASAILMTAFGAWFSLAGVAFGAVADLFANGLLLTSRFGATWFSGAGLRMESPDLNFVACLVLCLLAVAQWPRPRVRWRWLIVALGFATMSVWGSAVGRDGRPTLDVLFFDVGQGDAVLISTPGDRHLLVDTGPWSPDAPEAEYSILPYLERRGIGTLDRVVITHPDEDHLGGLLSIVREVSVERVVRSGRGAETELFQRTERVLRENEVSTRSVRRGDAVELGPSIRVEVLGPPANPRRHGIENRNDMSVALHLSYGAVDLLLPGDIEKTGERSVTRAYGKQLASRIVKIPHHGSTTSSTQEFVTLVTKGAGPEHAVVSVGRQGEYGMPNEAVLDRWRSHGARVYSTAQKGAIWLRSDGTDVWTVDWRQ